MLSTWISNVLQIIKKRQKIVKNSVLAQKSWGRFWPPFFRRRARRPRKSSRRGSKFWAALSKYCVIWGHSFQNRYGADQKTPSDRGWPPFFEGPTNNYGRISVNFLSVLKNFFSFFKKLKKLNFFSEFSKRPIFWLFYDFDNEFDDELKCENSDFLMSPENSDFWPFLRVWKQAKKLTIFHDYW